MANRNPKRKRGISVGSSPSLTLRVMMAAASPSLFQNRARSFSRLDQWFRCIEPSSIGAAMACWAGKAKWKHFLCKETSR